MSWLLRAAAAYQADKLRPWSGWHLIGLSTLKPMSSQNLESSPGLVNGYDICVSAFDLEKRTDDTSDIHICPVPACIIAGSAMQQY